MPLLLRDRSTMPSGQVLEQPLYSRAVQEFQRVLLLAGVSVDHRKLVEKRVVHRMALYPHTGNVFLGSFGNKLHEMAES